MTQPDLYTVNALNSFSFGSVRPHVRPQTPVDPYEQVPSSFDITPRPSVAYPYPPRTSSRSSNHTFGSSSASASVTSFSSTNEPNRSTLTSYTSVGGESEEDAQFSSDEFEDDYYDSDDPAGYRIEISSAVFDPSMEGGESVDTRSIAPSFGYPADFGEPSPTRDREDSVATILAARKSSRVLIDPRRSIDDPSITFAPVPPPHEADNMHTWYHDPPTSPTDGFGNDWADMGRGITALPNDNFARRQSMVVIAGVSVNDDRRPSYASSMMNKDSFDKALVTWDALDTKLWTFKREKADGMGPLPGDLSNVARRQSTGGAVTRLMRSQPEVAPLDDRERRRPRNWRGMQIGSEEIWGNELLGRYKVQRISRNPTPGPSAKGPQQRLTVALFPTPRIQHRSPTITIHKHSKANAFSISRFYRLSRPRVVPWNNAAVAFHRSAEPVPSRRAGLAPPSRDGTVGTNVESAFTVFTGPSTYRSNRNRIITTASGAKPSMILLAPLKVQKAFTSTTTTRKLESHGHLDDAIVHEISLLQRNRSVNRELERRRQSGVAGSSRHDLPPVPPKDDIHSHSRSSSASRSPSGSDHDSDSDSDSSSRKPRPHPAETYSSIDAATREELQRRRLVKSERRGLGRLMGPKKGKQKREVPGDPSAASVPVPWLQTNDRDKQESQEMIAQGISTSFKEVGLMPATRRKRKDKEKSSLGLGSDKGKKGSSTSSVSGSSTSVDRKTSLFDDISPESLFMILPLWPGDTDEESRKTNYVRPEVKPEDRQFLLVCYKESPEPLEKIQERSGETGSKDNEMTKKGKGKGKEKDSGKGKKAKSPTSSAGSEASAKDEKSILLSRFHITGRLVHWRQLQGSGIRIPDEGISVSGSLAEAYATMPRLGMRSINNTGPGGARVNGGSVDYDSNLDIVIARCESREQGVLCDRDGFLEFELCRRVDRQVTARDRSGLPGLHRPVKRLPGYEEEEEVDEPTPELTAVGKAVAEMVWIGALSLNSFGGIVS